MFAVSAVMAIDRLRYSLHCEHTACIRVRVVWRDARYTGIKALTLSSTVGLWRPKDLVLLRALPEPANAAACGRAGHSMSVWYRPLVLEKKSSSAH